MDILCFHKIPLCHFVFPQNGHVDFCGNTNCSNFTPYPQSIRGGNSREIFFRPYGKTAVIFWSNLNFLESQSKKYEQQSSFFQHVRSWKSCQGLESSTHVPVLREISIIFWTSWPSSNLTHPLPQSPCFDSRCTVAAEELLSRSILAAHGLMLVTPKESSSRS